MFVMLPCVLGIVAEADIKTQTCYLMSSITIGITYVLGVVIWYLYDVIKLGMNNFTDGNGYPLKPW